MATRRAVLAGLAGGVAAMRGATPASASARRRSGPDGGTRVERTDFTLSHLIVGWTGDTSPHARLRTASGWTGWTAVHAHDKSGRNWALLPAPAAVGYELDGATGLVAVELDTRTKSTPSPRRGVPLGPACAGIPYLSRAAWGADESLRYNPDGSLAFGPTEFFPVQTLTVHHTDYPNNDPDPAATVRSIYYLQAVTEDWGDIGYHLLIDEQGRVYEGRWSGPDPVPVFGGAPGPDGRPQMVTAAHVAGFNSGNIGVAIMGDLTSRLPTPAARRSLDAVLAAFCAIEVLDPLGVTNYVNPVSGATATVDTICGHRDWTATQCPGNYFYPHLPEVRDEVSHLLRAGLT